MENYMKQAEESLLHLYNRYPVILESGDGVYLYDVDGKKYLDFVSGIGVFALGYGNRDYNNALTNQIEQLIHTSNYYYNIPAIKAAKQLAEVSGMDKVFFTNSGAEAVEGAIKTARKYAYKRDGFAGHEIIAMEHSFHGRTMGALSVTGTAKYREPFEPLIGGVRFAGYNDFDSVKELITDKTCAIILETVQGEGGIRPADREFLKRIKDLCMDKDILLILDEIQCGMGRTGHMFAWQGYGIKPDIMACAKALTCGVPGGAFLVTDHVAKHSLEPGDHGSTFGGNPLAASAINKVLDLFEKNHIIENVNKTAPYLEQSLDCLVSEYDFILERRGRGLMQGLECSGPVNGMIHKALEKGLLLINAGGNVLRFLPPLVISRAHVDDMIHILKECLDEHKELP